MLSRRAVGVYVGIVSFWKETKIQGVLLKLKPTSQAWNSGATGRVFMVLTLASQMETSAFI